MPLTPSRERALLVGIASRAVPRLLAEEHLDELARLVETAGGEVRGRFVKERSSPDPATFVGKGAALEINDAARAESAALVVFDDELSPGQARNLEALWDGVRVLDRPGLILDIFASHARSREARTQVELAQLQYLLPRLAGRYGHLSRLGGGIGGRGAGEQKLELDRRKIRSRIGRLRKDLEKIETAREVRRRSRRGKFQVAIVGYTNAGKTTLFNGLTREAAYAADRLFATLDPRTARGRASRLSEVVFTDTVGLIRKLPTSLVASFRSTLAEVKDADLVLHVLDASSPRVEEERRVALEILEEQNVDGGRVLPVWTKSDLLGRGPGGPPVQDAAGRKPRGGLFVSGRTGAGIGALEEAILLRARPEREKLWLRVPYADGRAIAAIRARFRVLSEEDLGEAVLLRVAGDWKNAAPFREYFVEAPGLLASGT